jgi:hypothetical protein
MRRRLLRSVRLRRRPHTCGEVDRSARRRLGVGGVESVTVARKSWAWDRMRRGADDATCTSAAYRLSGVTTVAADVGALYPIRRDFAATATSCARLTRGASPHQRGPQLLGCKRRHDRSRLRRRSTSIHAYQASVEKRRVVLPATSTPRGRSGGGRVTALPQRYRGADWGWASCELAASRRGRSRTAPCYPATSATCDRPAAQDLDFFKWANTMGPQRLVHLSRTPRCREPALVAF